LEFKHVVVPAVDPIVMQASAPADEFLSELWHQQRRELYVAMTRGRDTLWVGCITGSKAQTMPRVIPDQRPDTTEFTSRMRATT
jgi:ATP-dependent exoDNAse (exonuclease V) beta subunit